MTPAQERLPEAEALARQALALFRQGQLGPAEECLRRLLRLRPRDPAAYNNLGAVLARRGRPPGLRTPASGPRGSTWGWSCGFDRGR